MSLILANPPHPILSRIPALTFDSPPTLLHIICVLLHSTPIKSFSSFSSHGPFLTSWSAQLRQVKHESKSSKLDDPQGREDMPFAFLGLDYLSTIFSNSIILANFIFSLLMNKIQLHENKIQLCDSCYNLIIHESVDGHLGWFYVLATGNRAEVNMCGHVSL